MSCPYKVNNEYIKEIDAFLQYIDQSNPQDRTAEDIYKLMKANKVLNRYKGQLYVTKYNKFDIPVQLHNLKVLNLINGALGRKVFIIDQVGKGKAFYQGFLETTNKVIINPDALADINFVTDVMSVQNRYTAEKVEELASSEDALSPEEIQRQAEEYANLMTDKLSSAYDEYVASEAARLAQEEQNTRFSKMSDMKKESLESAAEKIKKLQNAFKQVGVNVEVEFDNTIEGLGEVDTTGETPVIKLNPETFREDTVYHEFGHLFVDLLGKDNPLVKQALTEIRRSNVLEEVKIKYPELTEAEAEMEALVTAIGRKAAQVKGEPQSKLTTLIKKIIRAVGKLFGITPDATTALAEKLFAGEIQSEDLQGTITRDMVRESKANKKAKKKISEFEDLIANLKADTYLKIKDAENRLEQRMRKKGKAANRTYLDTQELARLKFLNEQLEAAEKVEDLVEFAKQAQSYAQIAHQTFGQVVSSMPSEGQRLTEEQAQTQIRSLMTTKNYLDSFWDRDPKKSLLYKLKKRVLNKIEARESKNKKPGKELTSMRTLIIEAIEKMERLDNDFERIGLPLLSEYLYNFHNTDIDSQMEDIIKNLESNERSAFLDKSAPEYQKLKQRKKEFTAAEYEKELSKLAVQQLKSRIPTKESLVRDLTTAHRDKSTFSHYFDPTIYSSNVAIQLMAIAIKSKYLAANEDTRRTSFEVNAAYDAYREATGKTDFNPATFNEGLFEVTEIMVRDAETDEYKPVKVKAFVQPTRAAEFKAEKTKFYNELNKKHGKPKFDPNGNAWKLWIKSSRAKNYKKEEAAWYEKNTIKTDRAESTIKSLNVRIAQLIRKKNSPNLQGTAELAWINAEIVRITAEKNRLAYTKPDGKIVYKGQLAQPNNKWANPKYAAMTTAQRNYYDALFKVYKRHQFKVAQSSLVRNAWDDFSYMLPSIRIDAIEMGAEQGVAQTFKDLIKQSTQGLSTDIDYGILKDINGDPLKSIPIFYTNPEDARVVSSDLASSVMRFVHMANMYEQKSNILSVVNLSLDIIEGIEVPNTNALGMPLVAKLLQKFGASEKAATEMRSGKDTNLFQSYEKFIDVVMYGEVDTKRTMNILGKEFDQNKLARTLTTYTALNTLAFNFLQAGAQGLYDNYNAGVEAIAKEYYSPKSMAEAYAIYWGSGAAASDLGEFTAKSKLGQWVQVFDALVEFSEEATRTRGGTKLKKAIDTSSLMVAQRFVEHSLQVRRSLALAMEMRGKLKDANGKVILNEDGKPASLWDVFIEVEPGIYGVDPKVANFNKVQFVNKHHGLSRRTNQIKGLFDRAMVQREAGGKLLMLYKNWVVPGLRKRFGHGDGAHIDEELGGVTEGMYISFWRLIQKSFAQKDIRQFTDEYSKMTDHEQANVRRTFSEIAGFLGASVLIGAIGAMVPELDDDDPNNDPYAAQYAIYQLRRFQTEISAFANPSEAWRLIKSPTATVRPVSNILNLTSHIAFKGIPYLIFNKGLGINMIEEKDVIQQRDGTIDKGDAKVLKYLYKAGFKGVLTSTAPGDALKFFDQPSEF